MKVAVVYNSFNLNSIVDYNVGYHYDMFNHGMPSLENKIVLSLPDNLDEERSGNSEVLHHDLLDWGISTYTSSSVVVRRDDVLLGQHST